MGVVTLTMCRRRRQQRRAVGDGVERNVERERGGWKSGEKDGTREREEVVACGSINGGRSWWLIFGRKSGEAYGWRVISDPNFPV